MGRHILFATIPAWGHTYPVLYGAAELRRRGHRVSCLASPRFAAEVAKVADPVPYDSPMDSDVGRAELADMSKVLRLMLQETRASFAALERVVRADPPDLLVSDVLNMAGWLVSRRFDLPLVRTWPIFASNEHFSLHQDYQSRTDDEESMRGFFAEAADFLDGVGLGSISPMEFFESQAERNIALFPRSLQPRGETFDSRYTFVAPCIRPPEESPDVPWLRAARPLAAVSLGTVFNEQNKTGFFRACVEGLEQLGWHAAVALGDKVRPEDVGPVSGRVLMRARLPMIDTLQHAAVSISHGGLTSTVEALAQGVPVLIAPQIGEQHAVADSVERLGLGVRLREPFTGAELAKTVKSVVDDADMARRLAEFRRTLLSDRRGGEFADTVERELAGQAES
ncbi:nucleotide disphospho-sugar-binding domain-containing protein [Nonomuraea terrae]|nr:nucleotide disphospho-sugar-binding domain-containing protein [Nonomuraea terrae]